MYAYKYTHTARACSESDERVAIAHAAHCTQPQCPVLYHLIRVSEVAVEAPHAPPVDVQMDMPHETRQRVSVLDAYLAQPRSNGNTLHCLPSTYSVSLWQSNFRKKNLP